MRIPFACATLRYVGAIALSLSCFQPGAARANAAPSAPEIQLVDGSIEGERMRVGETDLRVFRGIPYAAPPIGELRWREPQPVERWADVRRTVKFGPRCMQSPPYPVAFRSEQMSEDCLYLNVWTPARANNEKLPVLVYFHGGNLSFGDGSEGRYDGANLAAQGIVTVTVNYRLGLFGFLTTPELARESPHGAAGNYGLLDQHAALLWVRENIARFGGDPEQVTIGGDSAGAISVSAHMASPLSRGLFARAIGASGGAFSPSATWLRRDAEVVSRVFVQKVGAESLKALRALSADTLLSATGPAKNPDFMFFMTVDGRFLRKSPEAIFRAGSQAHVPLLVGTASHTSHYNTILRGAHPSPLNWGRTLHEIFGDKSGEALALYPGNSEEEVKRSAALLANDSLVTHATWRWMDMHRQTTLARVYFYSLIHPNPLEPSAEAGIDLPTRPWHGSEAEYALGNLLNRAGPSTWSAEDHKVSQVFSGYIAQFIKDGNPNRRQLPSWQAVRNVPNGISRQAIGAHTHTMVDVGASRQALLKAHFAAQTAADSAFWGDAR